MSSDNWQEERRAARYAATLSERVAAVVWLHHYNVNLSGSASEPPPDLYTRLLDFVRAEVRRARAAECRHAAAHPTPISFVQGWTEAMEYRASLIERGEADEDT